MNQHNTSYQQLIQKLDQFIRKYYVNQLIRGSLYTIGAVVALFLIFNTLEYFFYFSTGVRKLFFYSFLITTVTGFGFWVIDPLVRFFKLGHTISHEDAALIIGNHFGDVKDKLLNVLQLKKQDDILHNSALESARKPTLSFEFARALFQLAAQTPAFDPLLQFAPTIRHSMLRQLP